MWMMILMSDVWYARDYGDEDGLRENIADVFAHVLNGNVVAVADDLESWCQEMGVDQENVIVVEGE